MLKIVVATMAAACLVLPAAASAEEGGGAVDHLTCADGTVLMPPFSPPVCREHGGLASVTCADDSTLTPPFDGERCPAQAEGGDDPGEEPADPGADDGDDGDAPPRFDAGFLNRVVVVGKLVPEDKWLQDEDGELVPTLRAKRIEIKD